MLVTVKTQLHWFQQLFVIFESRKPLQAASVWSGFARSCAEQFPVWAVSVQNVVV